MNPESEPEESGATTPVAAFMDDLADVEDALAIRERARSRAWKYLTLRIPIIGALLYFASPRFYPLVGLVFVAALADLWLAGRRVKTLAAERDRLLRVLEDPETAD